MARSIILSSTSQKSTILTNFCDPEITG